MKSRDHVISGLRATAIRAAALAAMIGAGASAQVDPGEWMTSPDGSPGLRRGAVAAYDSAREVTVLFGGWSGLPTSDTWEWDGLSWRPLEPRGPVPHPRYNETMVYDSRRGVCVLYGGNDPYISQSYFGDTWEYDGERWTRRDITGPGARAAHAMAYDTRRGVTVLTGGRDVGGARSDTWEYDGNEWRLVATEGFGPRNEHAMTFDDRRGVCVLFSGLDQVGGSIWLEDTWEWNGQAWRLVADAGPAGRGTNMTFDSARGVSVIYGGYNDQWLGDMWEWDGVRWQGNQADQPGARSSPLAYDSSRHVIVLYGGVSKDPLGDMWEYHDGIRLYASTSCPQTGPAALQWKGGTPGGMGSLVYAETAARFRVPRHLQCAGTTLLIGHRNRRIIATVGLGPGGRGVISGELSHNACGGYLQVVDHATCRASNLVRIE